MQKRPQTRTQIKYNRERKKTIHKSKSYNRQQNQWFDRDETIFMLTKEYTTKPKEWNRENKIHSPITDTNTSDKITSNYLGWVQTDVESKIQQHQQHQIATAKGGIKPIRTKLWRQRRWSNFTTFHSFSGLISLRHTQNSHTTAPKIIIVNSLCVFFVQLLRPRHLI